jgi:hypothetical protein
MSFGSPPMVRVADSSYYAGGGGGGGGGGGSRSVLEAPPLLDGMGAGAVPAAAVLV